MAFFRELLGASLITNLAQLVSPSVALPAELVWQSYWLRHNFLQWFWYLTHSLPAMPYLGFRNVKNENNPKIEKNITTSNEKKSEMNIVSKQKTNS